MQAAGESHNSEPRKRIHHAYAIQYPNPLEVVRGEPLTVGREDDEFPGWVWCSSRDGRSGWVPRELISNQAGQAAVLQDYSSRELPVEPGDLVSVEDARHNWLLVRNARGDRGWIPASCAE